VRAAPDACRATVATRRAIVTAAAVMALAPVALAQTPAQPVKVGDPPSGKALVVFFRKWLYPSSANTYTVHEGHTDIGRLSPGTYFIAVVEPGWHTYSVRAEKRNDMQIEIEADEIYYVRFELDTGWILYQPSLVPAEQRQFDELSAKLKPSEPLTP
jgi:hypothetical protein